MPVIISRLACRGQPSRRDEVRSQDPTGAHQCGHHRARASHLYHLHQDQQFAAAAERAKQRGFRYRELFSAGHVAMISQPAELAKRLLE
jgi:hypothetical protein